MEHVFRQVMAKIEFQYKSSIDYPAHLHEDIELVYVRKGRCTAFCDGRKYILEENRFFLAFPNQVHHYTECEPGEYYVLILKPSRLLSYTEVFLEGAPVSAVCCPEDDIVYLLEKSYEELPQDGYTKIIAAYLTAMFGKLLKHYRIDGSAIRQDTILQILEFCAGHYRENISVMDIAEHLRISRSSVSHVFSARLGIHFCDYINTLRLTDAAELLINGNYSMTQVAETCGFPTIRTFNRAFAKQYGMSPSAYKKQQYNITNNSIHE